MSVEDCEDLLRAFQQQGNPDQLLEFVRCSGHNAEVYQTVLGALGPVFRSLHFGFRPIYEEVDTQTLDRTKTETEKVVRWMAGSDKADLKASALELMGLLKWKTFRSDLKRSLVAAAQWERLTAIDTLKRISADWARALLRERLEDADADVRRAARRALAHQAPRE